MANERERHYAKARRFDPGCDIENESMNHVQDARGVWHAEHVEAIDTYEEPILPGALPVHMHDEGFVPVGQPSAKGTTGRSND